MMATVRSRNVWLLLQSLYKSCALAGHISFIMYSTSTTVMANLTKSLELSETRAVLVENSLSGFTDLVLVLHEFCFIRGSYPSACEGTLARGN